MIALKEVMLTTTDNRFDPFTRWEDWLAEDTVLDHGCCELIGRISYSDADASPASQQYEYECAIDNIIAHDPTGIYKKVTHDVPDFEFTNADES